MEEGVCSMSTFLPINSACGRITSSIDIFDLELNPYGIICCPECELIIESREAWKEYA
jgi:hypothetical protein